MRNLIAALALGMLAAGCTTSEILNVTNAPVNVNAQQQDLEPIIEEALRVRGWQVAGRRPGEIDAYLTVRQHRADITISYDTDSYSIAYRDSHGLDYRNGMIHRNYNRWVNNLNTDIQRAMGNAPPPRA